MDNKKCYHCGDEIGFNSSYYRMEKAIKPPKSYRRYIDIGVCCELCIEGKNLPTRIDEWRK